MDQVTRDVEIEQEIIEEEIELSDDIIAMAKKLLEKQQKGVEKAKDNLAQYPFADPSTLTFDQEAKKNKVQVICSLCGEKHWRFTSDLFQTKGVCSECKKEASKEAKQAKKELLAKALKAIKEGKI